MSPARRSQYHRAPSRPASRTAVNVSPNSPVQFGAEVTISVDVRAESSQAVPSGTVDVLDGATQLATGVPLTRNGNLATVVFRTSALAIGDRAISARYNGDAIFDVSRSLTVPVRINQPSISVTTVNPGDLNGSELRLAAKPGVAYLVKFKGVGGRPGDYEFGTVSTLPGGLSLNRNGELSGTINVPNTALQDSYDIEITARDNGGNPGFFEGRSRFTLKVTKARFSIAIPANFNGKATKNKSTYIPIVVTADAVGGDIECKKCGAFIPRSIVAVSTPLNPRPTTPSRLKLIVATSQRDGRYNQTYDENITANCPSGYRSSFPTLRRLPDSSVLASDGAAMCMILEPNAPDKYLITVQDAFGNTTSTEVVISVVSSSNEVSQDSGTARAMTLAGVDFASAQLQNIFGRLNFLRAGLRRGPFRNGFAIQARASGGDGSGRSMSELFEKDNAFAEDYGQNEAMSDRNGATRSMIVARSPGGASPEDLRPGSSEVWTGGTLTIGRQDQSGSPSKLKFSSSGLTLGADIAVNPRLTLGAAAGLGNSSANTSGKTSEIEARSVSGVGYGFYRPDENLFVDFAFGYSGLSFDSRRRVSLGGIALGERDGQTGFAQMSVGLDGMFGASRFSVYGKSEVYYIQLDPFAETGGGIENIYYDRASAFQFVGAAGMTGYGAEWDLGFGRLVPRADVELRYDFSGAMRQRLQYVDDLSFGFETDNILQTAKFELRSGLGGDFYFGETWRFSFETKAGLKDNQKSVNGRIEIGTRF
jgi:hypothetical protein